MEIKQMIKDDVAINVGPTSSQSFIKSTQVKESQRSKVKVKVKRQSTLKSIRQMNFFTTLI